MPGRPSTARSSSTAARKRRPDPNRPPFSAYLDRDAYREVRRRGRRRTILLSLAIHAVAVLAVLAFSLFEVDELWAPAVGVTLMNVHTVPSAVQKATKPQAPTTSTILTGPFGKP